MKISNMLNSIFLKLVLRLIFIIGIASAIDTGKMAGKVFDKETGEPLPGANIMLLETTMV